MTRVDVIYTEDCPHAVPTVARVRAVAARLGVPIEIHLLLVDSIEDAHRFHFLGSPTVRVNSVDVDPASSNRNDFALCCRVYGRSGIPPESMIAAALAGHV